MRHSLSRLGGESHKKSKAFLTQESNKEQWIELQTLRWK